MKKIVRVGVIGVFHTAMYLWLIPTFIIPKFGAGVAVATTLLIIVLSLYFLFSTRAKKNDIKREL